MEHRRNPRRPTQSPVMVHHPRRGGIRANVLNYSAGGLLVEMGPYAPAIGALVRLSEMDDNGPQGQMFWLKARSVHSQDGLAGLMFIRPHAALLRALLESLEAPVHSPAMGLNSARIGLSGSGAAAMDEAFLGPLSGYRRAIDKPTEGMSAQTAVPDPGLGVYKEIARLVEDFFFGSSMRPWQPRGTRTRGG